MKLGQILMHRKIIVRDQLREALKRQRRTERPIGEILLQMGIVSHGDMIEALRIQPAASVDAATLAAADPRIVGTLPRELSERHCCMAVVLTDEVLVLAIADPLDGAAIDAIETATGMPVLPLAADPAALSRILGQKYAALEAQLAEPPAGPEPPANPS